MSLSTALGTLASALGLAGAWRRFPVCSAPRPVAAARPAGFRIVEDAQESIFRDYRRRVTQAQGERACQINCGRPWPTC
ncbi:hypothetical protein GCM10027097_19820 [Amycolatopsis acidiphila]